MPRIDIVFTDAGGGHRTVASALQTALQEAGAGWEVRLVNLADALASADPLRSFTGIGIQDAYNLLLRLGMGRIIKAAIPLLHLTIRLRGERQVQEMTRQWIESPPDIVVSAMSHFNGILKEALARARPDAPFVVLMARSG
jgi:1,2-diacylglycerol 3-beta-galactosyltransferase